ncbi:hypothetical protein GQ55_1G399000 [Panicum hallii var. hallii]|uniref:Uncharacterized protein n=1 Tax=Panicum hallii var. hallii TaxID=1504633 RepID=A0A2T7FCD1_9POAL|nr:hypothetical protein GQ55_1G399000 [Panicum hallii var. hallii]
MSGGEGGVRSMRSAASRRRPSRSCRRSTRPSPPRSTLAPTPSSPTLLPPPPRSRSSRLRIPGGGGGGGEGCRSPPACYDARVVDEAYHAACGALGAGRPDAAVRSLRVALASCPPERTAAILRRRYTEE